MSKLSDFLAPNLQFWVSYKSLSIKTLLFFTIAGALELAGLTILIPLSRLDSIQNQYIRIAWVALFVCLLLLSTQIKMLSERTALFLKKSMEIGERSKFIFFIENAKWKHISFLNQGQYNTIFSTEIPLAINSYLSLLQFAHAALMVGMMYFSVILFQPMVAILGVLIAAMAASIARRESRRQKILQSRYAELMSELNGLTSSLGSDLKFIKTSGYSAKWADCVFRKITQVSEVNFEVSSSPVRARRSTESFGIFLILLTILLGFLSNSDFSSSLVLIAIFYRLTPRLQTMQNSWIATNQGFTWLEGWMARQLALKSWSNANLNGDSRELGFLQDFKELCLENISFSHNNSNSASLRNVNVRISNREKVVIVGPSGSGKTTLLDIISGLHKPDLGRILVKGNGGIFDGSDSCWPKIGYVTQNPILIAGTLRENVTWLNTEISDSQIERAIIRAGLGEFVEGLRDGLNTEFSNSTLLSGGQIQRIAIARALATDPKILLLDESTSGMDENLEKEVLDTIFSLDVAVVMTSHRNYALSKCDRLIEIVSGEITYNGPSIERENPWGSQKMRS